MSIKMIVSDLDGTLFNSDEENYEVSKELVKKFMNLRIMVEYLLLQPEDKKKLVLM